MPSELQQYIDLWRLRVDGAPFTTNSGYFQPVVFNGEPCMLKIVRHEKDRPANELMIWWNGKGSARIWIHDDRAILMERAKGERSLANMAKSGKDNEATRILCNVTRALHSHRPPYPKDLVPLALWYRDLPSAAARYGGVFNDCAAMAATLLRQQEDLAALHGDIHHGNVLDFGDRGWLAIDPKALMGDRGFDYANIFCNPDASTALQPGRLEKQSAVVAEAARIDRRRLLKWVVAWAGLSAAWCLEDGQEPKNALRVAELALGLIPC